MNRDDFLVIADVIAGLRDDESVSLDTLVADLSEAFMQKYPAFSENQYYVQFIQDCEGE